MLESAVEKPACKAIFNLYGIKSIKLTPDGQRGWPDRLFWISGGRPLLIEFKRPGEVPDPLQKHRIKFLKKLGYKVEVCDDVAGAVRAARRALGASTLHEKRRALAS